MSAKRAQSVRNRSQSFAKRPRRVGHAGETNDTKIVPKRRTVVTFYVSHYKSVNSHRDRGVVVAKPRTVVTFGLVSGRRVSKVSTVTGIGGVVVAKPSTVVTFGLVSGRRVSKVSTVTGIGGVVVTKPRTVVTFGLLSGLRVSKVSTVTGIGGVVVTKPRTVVTFGLLSGLRVSKVSTVTGIGGVVVAKPRTVVTFGLVSGLRVSKCQQSRDWGGRGRETQNCRHFWTRLGSSRLKSVNSHRDRGVVVAKPRTVVTFGLVSGLRVSKDWGRNPELSSLLDSSWVSASQKCQ